MRLALGVVWHAAYQGTLTRRLLEAAETMVAEWKEGSVALGKPLKDSKIRLELADRREIREETDVYRGFGPDFKGFQGFLEPPNRGGY